MIIIRVPGIVRYHDKELDITEALAEYFNSPLMRELSGNNGITVDLESNSCPATASEAMVREPKSILMNGCYFGYDNESNFIFGMEENQPKKFMIDVSKIRFAYVVYDQEFKKVYNVRLVAPSNHPNVERLPQRVFSEHTIVTS